MNQRADVVVIGSGAAGGVMAYELARRGLRVVVLERGLRQDPRTFEHSEAAMFPRLYVHGGLQTTEDHNVVIAQGNTVGGSTVINNAIWLRPDLDRVLADWAGKGAIVPKEPLLAAYAELERALHVSPLPPKLANKGSDIFLRGCQDLGIPAEYLQNNRHTCIGCGWCNYGCKYNRKTSMLVTYLPWAEGRGASVLDNCRDVEIMLRGNTAIGARCVRNGQETVIAADRVVVCAGAIGSSAVLLQSGITMDGRVGQGLHVLGGVFVTAETNEVLNGFDGIGLTCIARASDEYVIESYFTPPVVFALGLGGWFLSHFHRMLRYQNFAQAGTLVGTQPTGKVWLDKQKRVHMEVHFTKQDVERLRKGIRTLANIYFAGGATRVFPATFKQIDFSSPRDIDMLDQLVQEPDDLLLGSAHPQGGNPISEDLRQGVIGNDFRAHGYENLYVADASVFPTNIWANCQATVMAMAHYAATWVARS